MLSVSEDRRLGYNRGRIEADAEIRRLLKLLDAQSVRLQRQDEIIRQQRQVIARLRR